MLKYRFWDNVWFARAMLLFLGLSLLGTGLRMLFGDQLLYANYWGGAVFAPFALAMGALLLIILVIKWNRLTEREPELKGKAARKARKAKEYRSTIDDFDKPWRGQR